MSTMTSQMLPVKRQAAAAQPEEGGEETGGELSPDDIPFS